MSQFLAKLEQQLSADIADYANFERLLDCLRNARNLEDTPKGWVDPVTQQKRLLAEIINDDVSAGAILRSPLNSRMLARLRDIAACYPESLLSLNAFIMAHKIINGAALAGLREYCRQKILVHISCSPRLHLAEDSMASFSHLPPDGYAQIIVVGSDEIPPLAYEFDAVSRVLTIGCSDNYESLPKKVFLTYFILSQVTGIEVVLKLDDDHRLRDQVQFEAFMEQVAANGIVFLGSKISVPTPLQNNRCWHMGKCESEALNHRPVSILAPTMWLNGAEGYCLKRPALVRLALVFITCEDEIRHAIYEDLLVTRALRHLNVEPHDIIGFPKGFDAKA